MKKQRIIKALDWMIKDIRHHHDDCNIAVGQYSSELLEADQVLDTLREEEIEESRCQRDVNCREFKCFFNNKGDCKSNKITLQSKQSSIVGELICVQGTEKE